MKKIQRILAISMMVTFFITSISTGISIKNQENNNFTVASQIDINYNFEIPKLETIKIENQDFTRVKLEGKSISNSSNPGEPVLPTAGCYILLPYGYDFESVQVTSLNEQFLTTNKKIEPGQQLYPLSYEGEIEFIPPTPEIYNSIYKYPGKKYDFISIQHCRGYNILILKLYPIQYDPANNKLIYTSSFNVKVTINEVNQGDIDELHKNFRGLQKDIDKTSDIIDNKNTITTYPGPFPTHTYEYVIITTNSLKNYNGPNNFQDLINAKIAYSLNSKIVTVEEIYSEYTGSDNQQKIRNFIKYAYNNWDTEYVLLGGDDNVVPARMVHIVDYYSTEMPSDLYYACLDEPAPSGSTNDDLLAEVYVGRACVGDTNEVANFVKKTIDYMNSGDKYLSNALWVGEHLGFGGPAEYATDMKEQNIGHCEDDGYKTDGLPEGGDEGYNISRLYDGPGYSWKKSDIMNKLNSNIHLLNHLGHANYDYSMRMYNSDIDALTNDKCFFGYSQGCNSGGFDHGDCAAEHFTIKTQYAAFAGVWNARFGWGRGWSTDGPSNRYDREFWDAIYGEDKNTLGWANHDSKEDNYYRINEGCMKWCYYETNLFGDPSLWVKGSGPQLEFSPKSYDFGKKHVGVTDSTTFQVWSTNSMDLNYNIIENYNWISVSPVSGTTSNGEHDTITVTIDTTYMSNGEYNADIQINSNGGNGVFQVHVLVGPVLGYSPGSHDFGKMREGETNSARINIWNRGVATLDYSFTVDVNWLTVSPMSGSSNGETDSITVSIDTTGMPHGEYHANIIINSNGGAGVFNVSVMVGEVLGYDPKSYDFGDVPSGAIISTNFSIWNRGIDTLYYTFSHDCDWVTVVPMSGESKGEKDKIIVTVNTQDLSIVGYHSCNIIINSNGGTGIFKVTVDVIAAFYSLSYDGQIYKTDLDPPMGGGYLGARNAKSGIVQDSINTIKVGQQGILKAVDPETGKTIFEWTIYRGFLVFDTSKLSDIPNDAVITGAWLSLYPAGFEANQLFDIILTNGQPTYPHTPLQSSDYNINNYIGEGGRFRPDKDNVNPNGYNKLVLNNIGQNWINKNGLTKFCLISSMDAQGQISKGENWINGYSSEGLYKPILSIDYGYKPNPPRNPSPYDGAIGVNTNVKLSVEVSSPDNQQLTVSFYKGIASDASARKNLIGVAHNVTSGGIATVNWTNLDYSTTYYWHAIADNGELFTSSPPWSFTTRKSNNPPGKPDNPKPADKSVNVDLTPILSVDVFDEDNDIMSVSFYVNNKLVGIDDKVESGKTASIQIADPLEKNTTYSWFAIADDKDKSTKSDIWTFTTTKDSSDNHAPEEPTNPSPSDGQKDVKINTDLKVDVYDPDGDELDVVFYLNDEEIGTQPQVPSGGTASITLTELEYNKTYNWYVVADDGKLKTISKTWTFTTLNEPYSLSVVIEKPAEGSIYFRNKYKFPFFTTIIIGKIDIKINITGSDKSLVNNVKIYINNDLKHTFENEPYNWTWDKFAFGRRTITVIAYNSEEKEIGRDERVVWKFF